MRYSYPVPVCSVFESPVPWRYSYIQEFPAGDNPAMFLRTGSRSHHPYKGVLHLPAARERTQYGIHLLQFLLPQKGGDCIGLGIVSASTGVCGAGEEGFLIALGTYRLFPVQPVQLLIPQQVKRTISHAGKPKQVLKKHAGNCRAASQPPNL